MTTTERAELERLKRRLDKMENLLRVLRAEADEWDHGEWVSMRIDAFYKGESL
jgi:hypothetical protein